MTIMFAYTALELSGLITVFFTSLGAFIIGIITAMKASKDRVVMTSIDTAVNGQESGMPTLVQHAKYTNKALAVIADAQGVTLPAKPPGDTP